MFSSAKVPVHSGMFGIGASILAPIYIIMFRLTDTDALRSMNLKLERNGTYRYDVQIGTNLCAPVEKFKIRAYRYMSISLYSDWQVPMRSGR